MCQLFFFFSSRRRHTRYWRDWSSDVCSSDLTRKVLAKGNLTLDQVNVIELNEAFASQALAVLRDLKIPDDAPHVNPNGGAIAIGHPLGPSGARLITTPMYQFVRTKTQYALGTMCIGVGQG